MEDETLSIILPAHNEEKNIPIVVSKLMESIGESIKEIIIIDDCSTDRTYEIAKQLSQKNKKISVIRRHPPNGLGRAVKDGLANASGDYILIMDSDLEVLPEDVPKLINKMNGGNCDLVLGSRFIEGSVIVGYPKIKFICNRIFNTIFRLLLGTHVSDLTFLLKLFKGEIVRSIQWESCTHEIAAELAIKPIALGFKVEEVPSSWIKRKYGKSKFRFYYNLKYVKIGIKGVLMRFKRLIKKRLTHVY